MYFLALPNFSEVSVINNSKLKDPILRNTPVLSLIAEDALKVLDEFGDLSYKYKDTPDNNQFNLETLDLFLKYKVTTVKTVKELVKLGKINISGIEDVLLKYES